MPPYALKLTRVDEYAMQNGSPQQFIINTVTQLGRIFKVTPASPNCTESMLQDVQVAVQIEDPTRVLSRNHAAIHPPTEKNKPFAIKDLRSTNGTFVNGRQLEPNQKTFLHDGDRIALYTGAAFNAEIVDSAKNPNFGLMVGYFKDRAEDCVVDSSNEFGDELEKRGFKDNLTKLFHEQATRKNIFKAIEAIKGKVLKDGLFVLHFGGHGGDKKLRLGEESLSARELFDALQGARGKILMILDGCYTASFGEEELPPRSALVGHTGIAYAGAAGSIDPKDNQDRFYTSRAITKALRRRRHGIDADQIVDIVNEDPYIMANKTVAECHQGGVSMIYLPSICEPVDS